MPYCNASGPSLKILINQISIVFLIEWWSIENSFEVWFWQQFQICSTGRLHKIDPQVLN